MDDKKALRKTMGRKRKELSQEQIREAGEQCYQKICQMKEYKETEWIYPFVSYQAEIDTHIMIRHFLEDEKKVAVPKVEGDEMQFYSIRHLSECIPGAMGILEPVGKGQPVSEPGIVIVPGLAFDQKGGRMGYGGGYYDKYLSGHKGMTAIAIGFDFQVVEEVPMEAHDYRMDYLVTPTEVKGTGV